MKQLTISPAERFKRLRKLEDDLNRDSQIWLLGRCKDEDVGDELFRALCAEAQDTHKALILTAHSCSMRQEFRPLWRSSCIGNGRIQSGY